MAGGGIERKERREEREGVLTIWPHHHMASISGKPLCKTTRCPNVNVFET
jgi:hypothetical protein